MHNTCSAQSRLLSWLFKIFPAHFCTCSRNICKKLSLWNKKTTGGQKCLQILCTASVCGSVIVYMYINIHTYIKVVCLFYFQTRIGMLCITCAALNAHISSCFVNELLNFFLIASRILCAMIIAAQFIL